MAVTFAGVTWNTTAGNKTVVATPAVGDLIVIVCANSGRTSAQAPTLTDNNSSGTYTQVKAATKNTSADSMWVFVRTAVIPAASSTTFTFAPSGGADSGGGLAVYRVTNNTGTGASAVRQSGSQDNQSAATPSITLSSPIVWDHAVIGGVFTGTNGSANSAPPSGFTEDVDQGYNTPASGLEAVSFGGGTQASTIAWTAATPSAFCSILVELQGPLAVPGPSLVTPIGTGSAV